MDLTEAIGLFEELKRRIEEHGDYLRESEYRTRILLIDPLLRMLGWDVEDFRCVEIEFRTSRSVPERADYLLKNDVSKIAIVEAKRLGTAMSSAERRQAKEYADYADASRCVLTDGAKWMLYDLNQGRNPDTMEPYVEFDIRNDVPEQLVLHCLNLWRLRFTTEVDSTSASNLPFESEVNNSQSDTSRTADEQLVQELPRNTADDSDKHYSFASGEKYPRHTKPLRLRIGNHINKQVNNWRDVIHEVAAWLVDEGMLSANDCPINIGRWTFINSEAMNHDGTPFRNPRKLPNGLILHRNGPTTREQESGLRKLLSQYRDRADLNTIQISYRSMGQGNQ